MVQSNFQRTPEAWRQRSEISLLFWKSKSKALVQGREGCGRAASRMRNQIEQYEGIVLVVDCIINTCHLLLTPRLLTALARDTSQVVR